MQSNEFVSLILADAVKDDKVEKQAMKIVAGKAKILESKASAEMAATVAAIEDRLENAIARGAKQSVIDAYERLLVTASTMSQD